MVDEILSILTAIRHYLKNIKTGSLIKYGAS